MSTVAVNSHALRVLVDCASHYADPALAGYWVGGGTAAHALKCYERSDHTDGTQVPAGTLSALLTAAEFYADPAVKGTFVSPAGRAVAVARLTLSSVSNGWN